MAYGSHLLMALIVLGAILLQLAIQVKDWDNKIIERVNPDDYVIFAEGLANLYRFISIWPLVGALIGIGRTLGEIPRHKTLGLMLFLLLVIIPIATMGIDLLTAFSAITYVMVSVYLGARWFLYVWRVRKFRRGQITI
mgnify:CR=1 FL=1